MGVFVIQVVGGQEDRAAALISKIAQGAVEDCFVPMREVTHRKSGQWRRTLEKLFPGYVFVQTAHRNKSARPSGACPHLPACSHLQAIRVCPLPPMRSPD